MIHSPIYIVMPRKTKADKVIPLNLNWYRNVNYIVNNQVKQTYCELMAEQLEWQIFNKPNIQYKIFYGRAWRHDKMNVGAVISKYFLDSLVHYGCIEDDSDEFVGTETFLYGGVDKLNPRCEITLS